MCSLPEGGIFTWSVVRRARPAAAEALGQRWNIASGFARAFLRDTHTGARRLLCDRKTYEWGAIRLPAKGGTSVWRLMPGQALASF